MAGYKFAPHHLGYISLLWLDLSASGIVLAAAQPGRPARRKRLRARMPPTISAGARSGEPAS
jgi:hypothetical protein